MKNPKKSIKKTPKDLLEAASEVFAEKGFRDATIAEICERAGANIASVNYHFGDKETLYAKAWRHCFAESIRAYPPDGGVDPGESPEERFRGLITALLKRVADKNNKDFLIAQKERANPTGLLTEVMRKDLHPLFRRMESLVRELLGPSVTEMQSWFCGMSVLSQCFDPIAMTRSGADKSKVKEGPPGIEDIDLFADHVVKFSLAGITAIREEEESKQQQRQLRKESRTG